MRRWRLTFVCLLNALACGGNSTNEHAASDDSGGAGASDGGDGNGGGDGGDGGEAGGVCPAVRADCDGMRENGCEVDIRSNPEHCGACGAECPEVAPWVSGPVCLAGRCFPVECNGGYFGDCDGDFGNGCEADLGNDAMNCGACGVECGSGTCDTGECH